MYRSQHYPGNMTDKQQLEQDMSFKQRVSTIRRTSKSSFIQERANLVEKIFVPSVPPNELKTAKKTEQPNGNHPLATEIEADTTGSKQGD